MSTCCERVKCTGGSLRHAVRCRPADRNNRLSRGGLAAHSGDRWEDRTESEVGWAATARGTVRHGHASGTGGAEGAYPHLSACREGGAHLRLDGDQGQVRLDGRAHLRRSS
eukprot:scaffold23627_cov121-Isochrysis_galbana.AAC.1